MNNTPRVEIRDEAGSNSENKQIGKELAHAHKLLCRLRHIGATRDDLVAMRDANLLIFEEFLGRIRGIEIPDDQEPYFAPINLDYDPGSFESLSKLSGGMVDAETKLSSDHRLGIWPNKEEDGSLVFGNMKFAVQRPSGSCVNGTMFCSGNLLGLSQGYVYLNLAMATWFSRRGIDIPFDQASPQCEIGNHEIFFLGTVWFDWNAKKYFAPTIGSGKNGRIKYGIKPIPDGEWPSNCYVAILVPR